ncbi:MAG: sensor histidine kinase [Anaeromyxobacteraceae bacterium]
MSTRSVRAQLVGWLLLPLAAVWIVDAVLTWATVKGTIDLAYDRALHGSALAISEHVTLGAGEPVVDLPPIALEMLDTGEQERVFYRVSYRAAGGADTFLTGYDDLPPAPRAAPGAPIYYDASYRGDAVRVAALYASLPGDADIVSLVQVAETLVRRRAVTQTLVGGALAAQVALIAVAAAVVWLGVARGLRPLRALGREVARRSPDDLTPVGEEVPREVAPLVRATNDLMARVRDAIAAQRRFVADASHQLRTPLAVLRAEADAALRLEDPAAIRAALERLRDHSQATSHLAAQLLALARAEPGSERAGGEEPVDLDAVAREACAALVPEALARGVDLGFEGAGPLPVRGRAILLREAIANLVDNALRYGRPAGRVTVSVGRAGDGGAVLAVEDDGPGLPAEERARVLDRFYRVPGTPGDGCGLGLAIVSEIARRHGATLHLGDASAGGLRVELRVPAADAAITSAAAAPAASPRSRRS